jgi:carbamoyl-phosphate synthase large subunit
LCIDQPRWFEARSLEDLERSVELVGGFPLVVRPSYVLSGAAMRVAHGISELREYVGTATDLSPEHPVVISKFESHAREIEFDGVAKDGRMALWSIVEHVEFAGVHSGDATLVLPPQELSVATIRTIRRAAARIAKELRVTGPLNIQFLARDNQVKVIECNLRASRSFPFVSKVLGVNFISEATRLMLGGTIDDVVQPVSIFDLGFVAVKSPQFSFGRLSGADPVLGIEMASTGEVACMGDDEDEALLKSMLATGFRMPSKGVLLSLGPVGDKYLFTEAARTLRDLGLALYATPGTAEVLRSEGVECCALDPNPDAGGSAAMDAVDAMKRGLIDFVINVPRQFDERGRPDGYRIRRAAIDLQIPLVTDLCVARKLVRAIARCGMAGLRVRSMAEYLALNGSR